MVQMKCGGGSVVIQWCAAPMAQPPNSQMGYHQCLVRRLLCTGEKRSFRLRSDHRGVNIVDKRVVDNMILKPTKDYDIPSAQTARDEGITNKRFQHDLVDGTFVDDVGAAVVRPQAERTSSSQQRNDHRKNK
jgi:hypothetical protein